MPRKVSKAGGKQKCLLPLPLIFLLIESKHNYHNLPSNRFEGQYGCQRIVFRPAWHLKLVILLYITSSTYSWSVYALGCFRGS